MPNEKLSIMRKVKITGAIGLLLLPSLGIAENQDEQCMFRRSLAYSTKNVYSPLADQTAAEIHMTLDTISLLYRRDRQSLSKQELVVSHNLSEDGKTLSLDLRQDCGWSDGTQITAEHVVDGLKYTFHPDNESYNPGRIFFQNGADVIDKDQPIDSLGIRATGPYSLDIEIDAPFDFFSMVLTRYNFSPYPSHLGPEARTKWEEGRLDKLSSGPYQVEAFDGARVVLERNPYFCQGLIPQMDGAVIYQVPRAGDIVSNFISGKTDFAEQFEVSHLMTIQDRLGEEGYTTVPQHDEIVHYATVFEESVLFQQPELRHALAMVIERDVISDIERIGEERAIPLGSVSMLYDDYEPKVPYWAEMNPKDRLERANQIMAGLGYSDENPLRLRFASSLGNSSANLVAAIKGMWSRLPVEVEIIVPADRDEQRESWKNKTGDLDFVIRIIGSDYPDPSDFLMTIANYTDVDPDGDFSKRIIDSFDIADRAKRYDALELIDTEMVEGGLIIPLYEQITPWLFHNGFEMGELFNASAYGVVNIQCD